jgi:hypothetical protein
MDRSELVSSGPMAGRSAAEQAGRPRHAGVLCDDVPGAAAEQAVRYPVYVDEVGVAQRGHAEQGRRLRAGLSPTAVLALEVAVRPAAIGPGPRACFGPGAGPTGTARGPKTSLDCFASGFL